MQQGRHQQQPATRITPQEAEAVIELWATRQRQIESERAMPNVQDLAEAISVPPEEVQTLLHQVRIGQTEVTPTKAINRRRTFMLCLLAAMAWAGMMLAFYNFAFTRGRRSTTWIGPPSLATDFPTAFTPTPMDAPIATASDSTIADVSPATIPTGTSITFRGYTLRGTSEVSNVSEQMFADAIGETISRMTPDSRVNNDTSPSGGVDKIVKALQTNSLDGVESFIAFEACVINLAKGTCERQIPIALSTNSDIQALVDAERKLRIQVLANQAANLLKGKR